jgi:methionine biosynthesis protein MetW
MLGTDDHSPGILTRAPEALRYESQSHDPDDVGMKLASLIAPHSRILDVGSGTGSVTELIQSRTQGSLVGIEPNPERAAAARARGLKIFDGFLSEEFLQAHGPFDFIIFADVLEHLPNPGEMVLLAKTSLTPGGSIVASVPNVAHWFVRVDILRGHFDYQDCGIMDATHLRWFTRKTIAEFFERLGFRITALDCTVNIDLPDYYRRAPWRWLKPRRRRQLAGALAKKFPGLFGCQHIIRATLPERGSKDVRLA